MQGEHDEVVFLISNTNDLETQVEREGKWELNSLQRIRKKENYWDNVS